MFNYGHQREKEKSYAGQPLTNPQVSRFRDNRLHELTDLPNNGASTSASGTFTRQDSLALAASLQQQDRERNQVDFMEAELDLDNYLQCFTDLDVPVDNVDFDDAELQKVNILYDGDHPFDQPNLNSYERHLTYGTGYQKPCDYDQNEYKTEYKIKSESPLPETGKTRRVSKRPVSYQEYQEEFSEESSELSDNDESVDDSYFVPESTKTKKTGLANFKPQTKARKYNLKRDEEKAAPTYKLKRARNNDAVRKSRNKAKELQQKKDQEHETMRKRIIELESLLEAEKEARKRDKELFEQVLKNREFPKGQRGNGRHALETFNK